MIVHQGDLLAKKVNFLLVLTQILLALLDVFLDKSVMDQTMAKITYLDALDSILDVHDFHWVGNAVVYMVTNDVAPICNKLFKMNINSFEMVTYSGSIRHLCFHFTLYYETIKFITIN